MNRDLASGPIVWLGIIVATCLLLVLFQTILWLVLPVMVAIIAYYVFAPVMALCMARGMTRPQSVVLVTILLTLGLVLLGLILAPKVMELGHNMPSIVASYTKTADQLVLRARATLSNELPMVFPRAAPAHPDTAALAAPAVGGEPAPAAPTSDATANFAQLEAKYSGEVLLEIGYWIPSLLLVPFITYFLLLDGPRLKRFIVQAIPNAFFEKTLFLFYRVEEQLRRYFQGLMALTLIDAGCLGVGLWMLGMNEPFLLSGIAAVMAWLPYIGSMGGGLLVVLVAAHDFPNDPWLPYKVIGLFIGVRLLDDFFFLPMTVGRSLQVHPLVTMLMFLLGGAVAGIAGLLLVMPVLGVVMVAGQIIGELANDQRILARHHHARLLHRKRARADLFHE